MAASTWNADVGRLPPLCQRRLGGVVGHNGALEGLVSLLLCARCTRPVGGLCLSVGSLSLLLEAAATRRVAGQCLVVNCMSQLLKAVTEYGYSRWSGAACTQWYICLVCACGYLSDCVTLVAALY